MEEISNATRPDWIRRHGTRAVLSTTAASFMLVGAALPAWAAQNMTLTLVRHGESEGNKSGLIDTSTPGPGLTDAGKKQAKDVANKLRDGSYDGIYASDMIRTQQTADPLSKKTGIPVSVLPGLHEIPAGIFEGQPESEGLPRLGYVLIPLTWTLGLDFLSVPGAESGLDFNDRMSDAIKQIYDKGDTNGDGDISDVVFSHGAGIMFWVMMNVDNPDLSLIFTNPLSNTDQVVVDGNPEDGWKLVKWKDQDVSQDPSLATKLFVDVRKLVVAPQVALYKIGKALASGDIAALANAVRDGALDVVKTTVGFVPKVIKDVADEVGKTFGPKVEKPVSPADSTQDPADSEAVKAPKVVKDVADKLSKAFEPKVDKPKADKPVSPTDSTEDPADSGPVKAPKVVKDVADKLSNAFEPKVDKPKVDKPVSATDSTQDPADSEAVKAPKAAKDTADKQGKPSVTPATSKSPSNKHIADKVKRAGDAVRKAVEKAAHGDKKAGASDKKADKKAGAGAHRNSGGDS